MNEVYFTLNDEKIYIEYNNNEYQLYRKNNNKLERLEQQEENKIIKLLEENYSYDLYSKKLKAVTYLNKGIENPDYLLYFLNWLEELIPEDCNKNFYNNLKTLKIDLNLNLNLNENIDINDKLNCHYDTIKNQIIFPKSKLKKFWEFSKKFNNPKEFYKKEYCHTLLHELCHMASTFYDKENNIAYTGFNIYPSINKANKNLGLTEGFTDLLASYGIPGTIEHVSSYYIETLICEQLISLVGFEVFNKSYFSNAGTLPIEDKLNKIIPDKIKIYKLFRKIETNFQIKNKSTEQNILSDIQNDLLDFLDNKCNLLDNQEEINDTIDWFSSALITKDTIKLMNENPEYYKGLEENSERFISIKNKYIKESKNIK